MSIYSYDNIRKIAKLTTRELPQKSKNAKITVHENNGLYSTLKILELIAFQLQNKNQNCNPVFSEIYKVIVMWNGSIWWQTMKLLNLQCYNATFDWQIYMFLLKAYRIF